MLVVLAGAPGEGFEGGPQCGAAGRVELAAEGVAAVLAEGEGEAALFDDQRQLLGVSLGVAGVAGVVAEMAEAADRDIERLLEERAFTEDLVVLAQPAGGASQECEMA